MLRNTNQSPVKSGVVYIVDDDAAVRDSLSWLLENNGFKLAAMKVPNAF